jgi:hypothetical protein
MVPHLHFLLSSRSQKSLKIERDPDGSKTIIRLGGRLQSNQLGELKAQLESDWQGIALDLGGVTLVDVEVVR